MLPNGNTSQTIQRKGRFRVSEDEIEKDVTRLSRNPFQNQLTKFLANGPTPRATRQAAQKSPDRWAQSVSIIAKLAGYNDKIEHEHTLVQHIQSLSDAELEQEVKQRLASSMTINAVSVSDVPVVLDCHQGDNAPSQGLDK